MTRIAADYLDKTRCRIDKTNANTHMDGPIYSTNNFLKSTIQQRIGIYVYIPITIITAPTILVFLPEYLRFPHFGRRKKENEIVENQ